MTLFKLCEKLQNSHRKLDSFIQINRNELHGTEWIDKYDFNSMIFSEIYQLFNLYFPEKPLLLCYDFLQVDKIAPYW